MGDLVANDDCCYDNAYEAFLGYATLHHAAQQCFRENLPKVLKHLNIPGKRAINILSIGAGKGQLDKKILETVIKLQESTIKSVLNRAIEPSSERLQQYQYSVKKGASQDPVLKKVSFEFVNQDFDEYAASNIYPRNQFDLIHAVHSFYFVKDVQQSLQYCYTSELNDKGVIMLVGGKENVSIFRKVAVYLEKNAECGSSHLGYMGTEGFVDIAQCCNYKYDVFPFTYSIDVSEIFCPEDVESQSGKLLLDFLTFQQDFRLKFDKRVVQEVCSIIRNAAKEDKNGRLIVEPLDELVVIYKQRKSSS